MENIKLCETCGKEHDGTYGSGRFCSYNCKQKYASQKGHLLGGQAAKQKLGKKCKCRFCGTEFETKAMLYKHYPNCKSETKKHRKAYNNWECPFCGIIFRTRNLLLLHKKEKHDMDKVAYHTEYFCKFCGRKSPTKSGSTFHEKYCKKNPNKEIFLGKKWTKEMKDNMSITMKKAHAEGRAFSWADLSKRREHSWPEKWLIGVLKNKYNLIEHIDYETEVKFHTFSLDFVFPNKKVIEIDGGQHKRSEYQKDCDKRKDFLLKKENWLELRLDWDYCCANSQEAIEKINNFING